MDVLKQITFSDVGTIASLIGLVLTVLVFFSLRSIRQYYAFTARAPELLKILSKHASTISECQSDFLGFKREIEVELARAEAILRSLRKKIDRPVKSNIKQLLKLIESSRKNLTSENVWALYIEMQKLITEIQQLQADQKWER